MITPQLVLETVVSASLFLFLWAFLGNKVFKPYMELLEEREARTEGDEKQIVETRARAERLEAQIEEALYEARLEGIRERDGQVEAIQEEARRILDEATSEAAVKLDLARAEIMSLQQNAQLELQSQDQGLASEMVKSVLSGVAPRTIH